MNLMDPILEKTYAIRKDEVPDYARHLMIGGGTRGGPLLVRGKGCWVEDIDGKKYIDCTSQSWALYLGYANDAINSIVSRAYAEPLSRAPGLRYPSPVRPGTEACRACAPGAGQGLLHRGRRAWPWKPPMKIAIKNRPGSQEFLCLYDSYHGTTLGTMGASWQSTLAGGKLMAPAAYNRLTKQFIRVPNPYCYRCPLGLKRESCAMHVPDGAAHAPSSAASTARWPA